MRLIATYDREDLQSLSDQVLAFYERRPDLQRRGISFGASAGNREADLSEAAKVSTDISLVWLDRSDAEAHQISDAIMRAVSGCLRTYLAERPRFLEVCPERALFVNPLFKLQRSAPGEGFRAWHCDWTTTDDATEPIRRVLAWILYLNSVPEGGTEFLWQEHHVEAIRGRMAIFPAGVSHVHRGRVSMDHTKTIATGWVNVGSLEAYVKGLASRG
ncbi:MAG: 2OG-Fe(II) oxygenase [Cyanobacteriota bacterium]